MIRTALQTIFRFTPVVTIILLVANVALTNSLASTGGAVGDLDLSIEKLRHENAMLEQQIASSSSLLAIGTKAQELGFVEPTKNQYLTIGPEQLSLITSQTR